MSEERRHRRVDELEGAQRAAAMAEGNIVVAAGAGSGKTTVLAARYVRLLETGRMPSGRRVHARNVLVLTFTRKAAAEMYARIYGALAEAATLASEQSSGRSSGRYCAADEELAGHLATCLSDFSQAQISTFDSFAARVARSGCARFGLAPDFAVDEDRARDMARDLALSFLLEHREELAIRDLVSASGLEGARDEVLAELAVRTMCISAPPDFAAFHALQTARLGEMEAEARQGLLAMRAAALDYAGMKTTPTSQAWLDALGREPGETEEELLAFAAPLEALRKPGSNSKDEASIFLSDCVPDIKLGAAAYRDIVATRRAQPGRLPLYILLDQFRERWDAVRRSEKTLTFRDVSQLALDVLETDSAVLEHYRELYRYLMIDEFQDDDELQKRVLFLLAGRAEGPAAEGPAAEGPAAEAGLAEDRLFFVGDEKQSIYLFRGADVSVFRRLARELGGEGAAALPLSRNFRSEPGVIEMINRIFPSVMAPRRSGPSGEEAGELEDFEARFEALETRAPTAGVEPLFVYLELPYDQERPPELREAAEAEAWEVARIVRDAVEGAVEGGGALPGSFLVADRKTGLARRPRYEDFAVLLRATGRQVHFEKYFRLFDVPYGSENACGLFSEAVACDLYYALRLALYPQERNAIAAYLRSPFAGLSDEGLVRLLASGQDPLGAAAPDLLPDRDRPCWRRGVLALRSVQAMSDRAPIAACLCFLWFEAGYRASLLRDPVASAFEEHFELVHTMAVEADARGESLASFVARLEPLVGKPDKLEIDLPREAAQGVRIMTVHKSKGLEFPVVIVPQANNVGQDRGARDSWYWEEGLGPTFRPPPSPEQRSRNAFFERARERRAAMEGAELKRLLYVALTRAESHIVVTATQARGEDAKGRSFRSLLAPSLGLFEAPSPLAASRDLPPFGPLTALPSGALAGLIPERSDREYLALVAGAKSRGDRDQSPEPPAYALIERRAWPLSVSVSSLAALHAAQSPAPAQSLEVALELAAPRGLSPETWGSLVHAVLEKRLAADKRELSPALHDALEEGLGAEGSIRGAILRAEALAEVFLRSTLGIRALAARERLVELKVAIGLAAEGGPGRARLARGSIDLAFLEEDRVIVVDYKTDSAMSAGGHDLQVAAYKRAAAEIFGLPAEAWVFYLYGGGKAILVDEEGLAPRLEEAPQAAPNMAASFGLKRT